MGIAPRNTEMAPLKPGVYTALVTPFTADGTSVDWDSYARLIALQIAGGVAGVVACGTTGESPTLSQSDARRAISVAVELCRGTGVLVLAGTGSNDTSEAVAATAWARDAGADAALVVNPYYNRPSQAGLLAHVRAILAGAPGLPLLLYNIPGRSGVNMGVDTIAALAAEPGVVGVKDATGSVDAATEIAARALPGFLVFSGDDGLTLPYMSIGAVGVVSVVSNLWPKRVVRMVDAALRNDFSAARAAHAALWPVFKGAFIETNPVPIKTALAAAGVISHAAVRLPLVALEAANAAKWASVAGALKDE